MPSGRPHSGNAPFGTEIIEVDPSNLSGTKSMIFILKSTILKSILDFFILFLESLQIAYDVIMDFEQLGEIPSDWSEATKMTEPCDSTVYCKVHFYSHVHIDLFFCGISIVWIEFVYR